MCDVCMCQLVQYDVCVNVCECGVMRVYIHDVRMYVCVSVQWIVCMYASGYNVHVRTLRKQLRDSILYSRRVGTSIALSYMYTRVYAHHA